MKKEKLQMKKMLDKTRRELELAKNKVEKTIEMNTKILRILDEVNELCAENESLKKQLADKQAEIDNLKQQLEKERNNLVQQKK